MPGGGAPLTTFFVVAHILVITALTDAVYVAHLFQQAAPRLPPVSPHPGCPPSSPRPGSSQRRAAGQPEAAVAGPGPPPPCSRSLTVPPPHPPSTSAGWHEPDALRRRQSLARSRYFWDGRGRARVPDAGSPPDRAALAFHTRKQTQEHTHTYTLTHRHARGRRAQ